MNVRGFKSKLMAAQDDLAEVVDRLDLRVAELPRHVERAKNRKRKSL
jgi:hypothetical protein